MTTHLSHIYVLDDDPGFLKATARLLASAGYDVTQARSVAELERLMPLRPDACLLVDIVLQGESGFMVPTMLCAAGQQRPIVFISATDDSSSLKRAEDLGVCACLRKPVEAMDLFAALQHAVDSQTLRM